MSSDERTVGARERAPVTSGEPEDDFAGSFADLGRIAYRVAYRILGVRAEAEDVAQEALVRAYVRWRKVRHYPEAWVARTAGNLAIDAWRHRRDRPRFAALDVVNAHDVLAGRLDLQRLLSRLPRRQRQVLILRYLADQTEAATAAVLGCSIGSVKRHAHRALQGLRAQVADERVVDDEPLEVNDVRESR